MLCCIVSRCVRELMCCVLSVSPGVVFDVCCGDDCMIVCVGLWCVLLCIVLCCLVVVYGHVCCC